ncbi:MAG: M20/M25/M40 family metallo-hydrolase [Bacteroidota bacterium]|uniref:M20/M25/M40 family metallo-hydrolase n=1 Tax=Flagellimonas okinawensis TaxID=3031324 RepID=A0ABT5XLK9_9FLAO|nr:M20/M25/M40 family metallo-hydrolase [[Muricauda] okinawensis]MDF0706700.1 M20/M25/M40 family metallo-hydrolase [[Muricauda] okinawensis]MEC8832666.1 M20/M25/M40 family metallo-hydrolase [Bacteroidota bacterium]
MTIRYFSTILALILVTSLSAQKLSRTEKKIVSTIEKNNQEAIGFLEKVVNINSGTLNAEGVKKVGMVFKDAFDDIGFETTWIEMPAEMNRSGHLFAETSGKKGKKLLLIGHLDTVFEEDSPFQTFEMVNDSIAHAPGGNDMKGGDVIVLYALKALHDNGLLNDAQIIVAFTGDEESTGSPLSISRKDLIDAAKRSDIALGFENSTGFNYATVARRGSSGWSVEVDGKRAHSSGIFSEGTGAGAIFEMSRILHEFYTDVKGEDLLTFNPGVLLGGTFVNYDELKSKGDAFGKSNVVAQKAVVKGGLRFISEEQKERARNKMREIVANNLPKTSATVSFTDSYPAMQPTEGNLQLLQTLNEVSLDLKQGEVIAYDPGKRGAADVSFVAEYVDGLDGLGTMGTNAHTPQETVNLNTIEALTKRTAILIYRLINTK